MLPKTSLYPEPQHERDRWILAQRRHATPAARHNLDPRRPYAFLAEAERDEAGERVTVATVFLTNRECPWRCLMCDLWRNTLTHTVPPGAISAQIDYALEHLPLSNSDLAHLPSARQVKLYNSGSFFDRQAIPVQEHAAIAARLQSFERVVVECHPALVGDDCWRFAASIDGRLEVAMGLETVHPEVGPRLNKRMTLEQFAHAATRLRQHAVALRVFILVKPPFLDEAEALYWAKRSLDFAFDCGATVACLIPTRPGNGALEALAANGEFAPPRLATLEAAAAYGIKLGRGRVFADVWDLQQFSDCTHCFPARLARLQSMNLEQTVPPPATCQSCGELY